MKERTQYAKPETSYAALIYKAISSSENGIMKLSNIYEWIAKHYPYFRTAKEGWRNAIRHNLTVHRAFRRMQSDGTILDESVKIKQATALWGLTGLSGTNRNRKRPLPQKRTLSLPNIKGNYVPILPRTPGGRDLDANGEGRPYMRRRHSAPSAGATVILPKLPAEAPPPLMLEMQDIYGLPRRIMSPQLPDLGIEFGVQPLLPLLSPHAFLDSAMNNSPTCRLGDPQFISAIFPDDTLLQPNGRTPVFPFN